MENLLQIGIGGAIIGVFFIPYIRRQDKKIEQKDAEIKALNEMRFTDLRDIITPQTQLIREFNNTTKTIFEVIGKHNNER